MESDSSDVYYSTLKSYYDRHDSKYAEDMLSLATTETCSLDKPIPSVPPGLGLEHLVKSSAKAGPLRRTGVEAPQWLSSGIQDNFPGGKIEEGEFIEGLDKSLVGKNKGKGVVGKQRHSGRAGDRHGRQRNVNSYSTPRSSSQPPSPDAFQHVVQSQLGFPDPLLQSPRPRARSLPPPPEPFPSPTPTDSQSAPLTSGFGLEMLTGSGSIPSQEVGREERWDPRSGEPLPGLTGLFSGTGNASRLTIKVPPIGSERQMKKVHSAPVSPTTPPPSPKLRWAEPARTLAKPVTTYDTNCDTSIQVSVFPVNDRDGYGVHSSTDVLSADDCEEDDDGYNVTQAGAHEPYAAYEKPPGIRYPPSYLVSPLNPWKNALGAQDLSGLMALFDKRSRPDKRISPFKKRAFKRLCPWPSHSCHCIHHPPRTKWKDLLVKQHRAKQRLGSMREQEARSRWVMESYSPEPEERTAYRDVFDLDEDMDLDSDRLPSRDEVDEENALMLCD